MRRESLLRRLRPGCDSWGSVPNGFRARRGGRGLLEGTAPSDGDRSAGAVGSIKGRRIKKCVPLGVLASALIEPPCSCTILAAIDRPRPVPRRLVEE